MGALQLQTVRFKDDSTRTISVRPNSFGDVPKKDFYVREVKVGASPKEPILSVPGFGKRLATAERYLVLSESHMLVDDVDTVLDDGSMDASRITFRVSDVVGGTLQERVSTTADWARMSEASIGGVSLGYYAFTLADLQGGLVAFFPDAGASMLAFKVQAADDGDPGVSNSLPHLSDSDLSTSDLDPHSVSVSVVALETVVAGKEARINEDGRLTPNDDTLDEWLAADKLLRSLVEEWWLAGDNSLRIFVELQKGKSGIVRPSAGVVQERLSVGTHSVPSNKIAVSWDVDVDHWRLSLQGSTRATRADFQEVLGALRLQTVHSAQGSDRTILVKPDISVSVARAGYYLREVEVSASAPNPILEVNLDGVRMDSRKRLVLTEGHILVYDPDTPGASLIEFRVTGLTGGTLEKHVSGSWVAMTKVTSQDYYAFTLAELRAGQISIRAGDGRASGSGTKIVFRIQAADDGEPDVQDSPAHLSDSDPNDDDADPVTSEIPIIVTAKATAGIRSSLNADRVLTPNDATLNSWKQTATTYRGTLHVVAKLLDKRIGDVLSLRSGYDTSKVTSRWDGSKGELSMKFDSGASISEIKTTLGLLELNTKLASSASTRKVRIFPTLSAVRGFRYRFDETTGTVHYYVHDTAFQSFSGDGKIFARLVELGESPPNPMLRVDFSKFQAISQRRVILTEHHLSVKDVDTLDPLDDTKVDGSRITFRVRGISGAKLQHLFEGNWRDIPSRNRTQEFTLRQLWEGLVSLLPNAGVPNAGVSTLTFEIQAHDGTHLSDSDYYDNEDDADPIGVSIRVVALKEIYAGKEMPVNDDRRSTGGDGGLTPSDATLDAWIGETTSGRLKVLVRLEGGKKGDALFLEDGHGVATTTIASSWSWDYATGIGILSLQSDGTATADDFQAVLNALALRTVRSASASFRTISARPDIAAEVPQKDYYARDVLIRESGPRPYVGERKTLFLQFGQDDRVTLLPSLFVLEDFDTPASNVKIMMRSLLSGAELHRSDGSGGYTEIMPENDASQEFTLEEFQQGLIAIYLSNPLGKKVSFELEAEDDKGNRSDISKSNAHDERVREFTFHGVLALAPGELEVDLQTGYQKAVPFGGLEQMIEEVRSSTTRIGAVSIVLRNAVQGDRLVMFESVAGITGRWSHQGRRYALTVSDGDTTSAQIDAALAQVYYRARESATEQPRELVVSWIDSTRAETVLLAIPLANRPPVLRNWGIAARYHDITPARGASETPLDLGYHPFREYMPDILDNEGKVLRLEIVLTDKADGVLSADERVFLSQELQAQAKAQGFVFRSYRSSDDKARALVIEVPEERQASPEFMTRILQSLLYLHGASGRGGDVGERRRISVAVFDGEAYSQTRTMEVRLVDKTPDPAKYVNTFIGTAEQKRMGVAGLEGNIAGMTFPGASYPFGMVKFSPDSGGGFGAFARNGGYRRDVGQDGLRFGLQYLSGPGCAVAGVGEFKVGVSGLDDASDDWSTSDESSSPGYYQVGVKDGSSGPDSSRINVELTTGSARTGMMRLTYDTAATGGWIDYAHGSKPSARSLDDEWIVQYESFGMGICVSPDGYWMQVSFHIKKDGLRNLGFSGKKLSFDFEGDNREVLGKVSMSYVSKANARENVETENPVGFRGTERAGSQSLELLSVEGCHQRLR